MKTCFLGTGAYTGKVEQRGWPVPPELCDRQEAANSMARAVKQYQMAEEAGFDWVSLSEHHYAPGIMIPNTAVLAAAVSQKTSRVKIALLGPLVPLLNPIRAAEEIAMLDALSNGRVVVLFLRGTPNEHGVYAAIDPAKTREITQEGVKLIKKAWTEPKPFSWEGEHFNYKTISVWPRTVQDPHPPIFYSGNSEESAEFAGTHHLSLAIGFAPVPIVKKQIDIYKAAARAAGWEPTRDNVLYRARALIAETDEKAQEMASAIPGFRGVTGGGAQAQGGAGGGNPNSPLSGFQFLGGPDSVTRKARELSEVGVGIVDISLGGGMSRSMELFQRAFAEPLREVA